MISRGAETGSRCGAEDAARPWYAGGMFVSKNQRRCQPVLEGLEPSVELEQRVAGRHRLTPGRPGGARGDRARHARRARAFTQAYLTRVGDPSYNPALDLNHNGQIGQEDGRLLLHSLPPLSPKNPPHAQRDARAAGQGQGPRAPELGRGHAQQGSHGPGTHDAGGARSSPAPGRLDLKLRGPAIVADAHGNFSFKDQPDRRDQPARFPGRRRLRPSDAPRLPDLLARLRQV